MLLSKCFPPSLGCRCLVATHYHQLALLGEDLSGVTCHKLLAKKDEQGIIFTYKIEVCASHEYTYVHISRNAGAWEDLQFAGVESYTGGPPPLMIGQDPPPLMLGHLEYIKITH